MSTPDDLPRRRFLVGAAGALLGVASCAKSSKVVGLVCTDLSGLVEADRTAREGVAYADRVADAAKQCDACRYYVPAAEGCGGCKLVRGPVHPLGTCRVFAPKG